MASMHLGGDLASQRHYGGARPTRPYGHRYCIHGIARRPLYDADCPVVSERNRFLVQNGRGGRGLLKPPVLRRSMERANRWNAVIPSASFNPATSTVNYSPPITSSIGVSFNDQHCSLECTASVLVRQPDSPPLTGNVIGSTRKCGLRMHVPSIVGRNR